VSGVLGGFAALAALAALAAVIAVIAVGWIVGRGGILGAVAPAVPSWLSFFVAMPALLFHTPEGFDRGVAADAVVASGSSQVTALWALREGISEAQNFEGPSLEHDVTVPVSSFAAFVARTDLALQAAVPGIRIVTYGHIGDGNLQYNRQSKAGIIGDYKDAYELQLMRGVKELFDPAGLMNPGKVLPNA
jgi:FAD/FMN-containing dehydrogenase